MTLYAYTCGELEGYGRVSSGDGGWGVGLRGSHLSQHNNTGELIGQRAHFVELFHSDRLIMKHCATVVWLEERWTDCSPG